MGELTFVLGGTRSGKSRFARERATVLGGDRVTFVATARPGDPELDARIAAHRRDRPPAWRTVEVETDLEASVATAPAEDVLLLDSLTLWVSWCLDRGADARAGWAPVGRTIAERRTPTIVVSDEVGLGIVPPSPLARRFVDDLGALHQRVAHQATTVVLLVAGVPIFLKGSSS